MTDNPFSWLGGGAPGDDLEDAAALNEQAMADAARKTLELAQRVYRVFGTPEGVELMEFLDRVTIRTPLMRVSGTLVEGDVSLTAAEWAYVREGQNSVVRWLQNQMDFAANPPAILKEVANNE